jgi:hypothetical protein
MFQLVDFLCCGAYLFHFASGGLTGKLKGLALQPVTTFELTDRLMVL